MTRGPPRLDELSPTDKRALLARILLEKSGPPLRYPLSLGQRALYLLHLTTPQSPVYNMALAMQIRAQGSPTALRTACQGLLARHPCLRSRIVVRDGEPMQEIDAYQEVQIEHRQVPEADLDQFAQYCSRSPSDPLTLQTARCSALPR